VTRFPEKESLAGYCNVHARVCRCCHVWSQRLLLAGYGPSLRSEAGCQKSVDQESGPRIRSVRLWPRPGGRTGSDE